jgi:anti-sigma factor RsiW
VQHVDEGMIHAFLDGELSPAERTEFERHISVCAPCRAKFAEEQAFATEAAGLVVALDDVPPGTRPATTPVPLRRPRPWVLRPSTLAWAASIVAAAGIGYTWRGDPAALDIQPSAVVENATSKQTDERDAVSAAPEAPVIAQAPVRRQMAAERRDAPASPSPAPTAAAPMALADASPSPAAGAGAVSGRSSVASEPAQEATQPPAPVVAQSAAAKPADSALGYRYERGVPVDTGVAGRLAFGPPTTAEPKRITMDEAVSLLGGSIQLIDGLTPQRVEVIAGIDVPGADPNRQVVRIYYEEPDLGLVTLDQQRPGPSFDVMRRGSAAPTASAVVPFDAASRERQSPLASNDQRTVSWREDGVWLALTTRLPADRMAALQARVK